MKTLPRARLEAQVRGLLRESPVVALLGPRQSGKTTLARQILQQRAGHIFDLESPRDLQRLSGTEIDMVVTRGRAPIGIEVKWSDAPRMTKSMHTALADIGLRRLFVVYPGPTRYSLAPKVEVIPLSEIGEIENA